MNQPRQLVLLRALTPRAVPLLVMAAGLAFSFWLGTRFPAGWPRGDSLPLPLATLAAHSGATTVIVACATGHVARSRHVVVSAPIVAAGTGSTLDLNHASLAQMRGVLHMRASTARKIIAYRETHGLFHSLDDLRNIPLSQSTIDRWRTRATVLP